MAEQQVARPRWLPTIDRWWCLAAGLVLEGCSGLHYTFANYSEHLKTTLHYTQSQTDGLGAAKDFGGLLGTVAGLLYNLYPPWVTVFIGACAHAVGYGVLWGTAAGRMVTPFWSLCLAVMAGVGGDSWIDTAALVSNLRNFPRHRGIVMGVLKAQVGLSAAIFTMLKKAYMMGDTNLYLLCVTGVPPVAAWLLCPAIRGFPPPAPEEDDQRSTRPTAVETMQRFRFSYAIVLGLAVYLMVVITLQELFNIGAGMRAVLATGMLLIISLIACIPCRSITGLLQWGHARYRPLKEVELGPLAAAPHLKHHHSGIELPQEEDGRNPDGQRGIVASVVRRARVFLRVDSARSVVPLATLDRGAKEQEPEKELHDFDDGGLERAELSGPRGKESGLGRSNRSERLESGGVRIPLSEGEEKGLLERREGEGEGEVVREEVGEAAKKGYDGKEDMTLWESLCTVDFWLLFISLFCGAGSGLTIINNLAQMGEAVGSEGVESFVALLSIWSCFGRLIAGYGSDIGVQRGIPRPLFFVGALLIMAFTTLLLSTGWIVALYVGSILVGLSYGSFWSLTPAIASERFGLHHFGANYKIVAAALPLGAYVLSAKIAGPLYDREMSRFHAEHPSFVGDEEELTCYGTRCFGTTLLILSAACLAGAAASSCLAWRMKKFYLQSAVQLPQNESHI